MEKHVQVHIAPGIWAVTTINQEVLRMTEAMYQPTTPEVAARRRKLAPDIHAAWDAFSSTVLAAGAAFAHSTLALNGLGVPAHAHDGQP